MVSSEPRILVVINGNAKSVNEKVIATLRQNLKAHELVVSQHIEEVSEIAQRIVEDGYKTVLTGGGDGTFSAMVTEVVLASRKLGVPFPQFGLLKLGTGNAMASLVGACPVPNRGQMDLPLLLARAARQHIRLVAVDGHLTPFAGLGADAQILADYNRTKALFKGTPLAKLSRGLSGYALAAFSRSLPAMAFKGMPPITIFNEGSDVWPIDQEGVHKRRAIARGDVIYHGPARMVGLSTIPYYGFGMKLFPFADARKGRLNLRISRLGPQQVLTHFRGIWNGTYHDPRYFSDYLVESLRIESETPLAFQIGGDSHGARNLVHAGVSKDVIELLDFSNSTSV